MKDKIGLVLEGGAMRGMYTCGVLDVFMEHHICLDGVIGVSSGALFGCNYVSGQIGRAIRYNKKYNKDKNYIGLRPLLKEGNIIAKEYGFYEVPFKLDPFDNEAFMKSGIPFYAVITNVDTGKAEYELITNGFKQMEILRASGSMPMVSKPVIINNQRYLDGGIADSIPYQYFYQNGYPKNVIILTQDKTYQKKPFNQLLANTILLKYPKIREKMLDRHLRYNQQLTEIKELEKQGKAFVIRPSIPVHIKKLESDEAKLEELYQLGRKDALNQLEELKKYIQD